MLQLSVVKEEYLKYTKFAKHVTMTSFAVVKDTKRDRLISWPRMQNEGMPKPPYADLLALDLLQNIGVPDSACPSGFFFDIANMFHTIRLPPSFAKLLPMSPILFGSLSKETQSAILSTKNTNLHQHVLVRPLQTTMPMGFKWSVFIAHTIAKKCIQHAYQLFL